MPLGNPGDGGDLAALGRDPPHLLLPVVGGLGVVPLLAGGGEVDPPLVRAPLGGSLGLGLKGQPLDLPGAGVHHPEIGVPLVVLLLPPHFGPRDEGSPGRLCAGRSGGDGEVVVERDLVGAFGGRCGEGDEKPGTEDEDHEAERGRHGEPPSLGWMVILPVRALDLQPPPSPRPSSPGGD